MRCWESWGRLIWIRRDQPSLHLGPACTLFPSNLGSDARGLFPLLNVPAGGFNPCIVYMRSLLKTFIRVRLEQGASLQFAPAAEMESREDTLCRVLIFHCFPELLLSAGTPSLFLVTEYLVLLALSELPCR